MSTRSLIYVSLQFICAAALVLSADVMSLNLIAAAVSGIGLAIGVWSIATVRIRRLSVLPEVKAKATLITHGPYRWIRHPMYSGLILFCCGFVLTPFEWWKLTLWCVVIVVLRLKAGYEEQLLAEQFPKYGKYRVATRRFIPFIY